METNKQPTNKKKTPQHLVTHYLSHFTILQELLGRDETISRSVLLEKPELARRILQLQLQMRLMRTNTTPAQPTPQPLPSQPLPQAQPPPAIQQQLAPPQPPPPPHRLLFCVLFCVRCVTLCVVSCIVLRLTSVCCLREDVSHAL